MEGKAEGATRLQCIGDAFQHVQVACSLINHLNMTVLRRRGFAAYKVQQCLPNASN